MKTLMMSTVAAVFAAGTAYADPADVLVVIDTDADGVITQDEYQAWAAQTPDPMFDAWDRDRDEMITRDEWDQGVWTSWEPTAEGLLVPDAEVAWEEDDLRYDATRSGREVSGPAQ